MEHFIGQSNEIRETENIPNAMMTTIPLTTTLICKSIKLQPEGRVLVVGVDVLSEGVLVESVAVFRRVRAGAAR